MEPFKITADFITQNTNFRELVYELEQAFAKNQIIVPDRHHHDFPNNAHGDLISLLLMPAWLPGVVGGVKILTINPENGLNNLPSIQGEYFLIDATSGKKKVELEATSLTANRTAATSALASKYLSRQDSKTLLIIGTGRLAVPLIKAHVCVRPIRQVLVWGRNRTKSKEIAKTLKSEDFEIESIDSIDEGLKIADIISTATLSPKPLVEGSHLQLGQHLDLVGAFKPTWRESDDRCVQKSVLFIDCMKNILEGGDLAIPLKKGIIVEEDIRADLFDLCSSIHQGRKTSDEITLFNSVGHALEDLVAAQYYLNLYTNA